MSRPARIRIDSQALQHNLKRIREYAPESKLMIPVKCDAYGHGIRDIVSICDSADAFAVTCLEEAYSIRPITKKPIVLLEGVYSPQELHHAQDEQCELVVHCHDQLQMLEQHHGRERFNVWLKINTGMCRLGIAASEFPEYWERLNACKQVNKPIKLMTHFANADDPNDPRTQQQIDLFNQITEGIDAPRSMANSGGIITWPNAHVDWVRPGIMLYGISPMKNTTGKDFDLQTVMTLSSEIISVQKCKEGDRIGYGGDYTCPQDMPVGIVAIGYGDGYNRHIPTGAPVLIDGKVAPIVGRVSMDMIAVDLTEHPHVGIGSEVILWGEDLAIETIAKHAKTIPYELLCNLHYRVIRHLE